jgi:membrane fusion protein (multidrug efflux system)
MGEAMPEISVNRVVWSLAVLGLVATGMLYYLSPSEVARRERAAALEGVRSDADAVDVASPAAPHAAPSVAVEALQITRGGSRSVARVSGLLAPLRSVTLSPDQPGAIEEVLADEHTRVEAGALLVRLDATARKAMVDRGESALIGARAAHRLAKLELERQQNLSQRDFTSTSSLDRALNQERAAFAALGEARASLAQARDQLAKTEIRAPFAGIVNWLDLEPGAYLQKGERVAEILDLSSIEVEVGVTDHQVVALAAGDPVEVRVDVFPAESFPGRIVRIGRSADARSQKYPVEVQVPNPGERLLSGMVADVVFDIGADASAIQIPRRATIREYELDYVYVLESRNGVWQARRRRVSLRPVAFRPHLAQVVEGLEEGEQIAVTGVAELRDGLSVQIDENRS